MPGEYLGRFVTPGASPSRIILSATFLSMMLLCGLDIAAGINIRLHVLYVFPLTIIAIHSERLSTVIYAFALSISLQLITFSSYDVELDWIIPTSLIVLVTAVLVVFLARAVRTNYLAMAAQIAERKQAELEVRRLHEELKRHTADLERRVAERTAELEAAKTRAEASDRIKSVFLATMSHELRTPLNGIIGFTGVLLQKLPGPLNAEQEKQLGMVRDSSRHLLALISDILDISKVEAGELNLAHERFDLHALLKRVGTAFAQEAARRGLAFELDIGDKVSIVTGDTRRVEQVLNNLLSNALKFTPCGTITLAFAREGELFTIVVTDTGVGIKSADMDKLFRPFSQLDSGHSGVREGAGLGLAISMYLAQAMGGQMAAESEWGKGSRFTFTLPAGSST